MSTALQTLTRTRAKEPAMWAVVIHNDDFTPFEFVIKVLSEVFHKTADEAAIIAGTVHENGKTRLSPFTKEVAQDKVYRVTKLAEHAGHPLLLTAEEA